MVSLFNIEKSAFRRGVYIGYALGHAWTIRNTNGRNVYWTAQTLIGGKAHVESAKTLRELSAKLAELDVKAVVQ